MQRYNIPLVEFEAVPKNYSVLGTPSADDPMVWEKMYEFLRLRHDQTYVKHFVTCGWDENPDLEPHRPPYGSMEIPKGTLSYTITLYTEYR